MICEVAGCECIATRTVEEQRGKHKARLCARHADIALQRHPGPVPDEEYDAVWDAVCGVVIFEPPFTIIPMPYNADGGGPEMDPAKVVCTVYEIWDIGCRTLGVFDTLAQARQAMEKLTGA